MLGSKPMLRVVRTDVDLEIGLIYTHERQWMPKLLTSLEASARDLETRLVLVDNASQDGIEQWGEYYRDITCVRNASRLHYAANLNRILEKATAPYILLLNTDVFFDPAEQCLTKMVDFMESHPDCGIAGCQVYHPDGSYAFPARRFQNLRTILSRRLGLGRFLPGAIDSYFYNERNYNEAWQCDWLSGCFMLVRRAAIADVGPFDAGFSKYFEDVDMCLRIAMGGWQVMFNGGTFCFHMENRGSKKLFSLDALRHLRSYGRWLRKWGFSPAKHIAAAREAAEAKRDKHAA